MKEFDLKFDKLIAETYDTVNHDDNWGTQGGGENEMEWYGVSGDNKPVQKRKRGAY